MELTTFLVLGFIILILCKLILKVRLYTNFVAAIDKIPGPTYPPFCGNEWQLKSNAFNMFNLIIPKLYDIHGSIFRIWIFSSPKVLVKSPQDIQCILQGRTHINKSGSYNYLAEFTGNSAITNSGQEWQRDRKILNPIFSRSNLLEWLPIVNNHVGILVEHLKNFTGKEFIIHKEIHHCVSNIVYECFFGYNENALKSVNKDLFLASFRADTIMSLRVISGLTIDWIYNLTNYKNEMKACRKLLDQSADKVIDFWRIRVKYFQEHDIKSFNAGDQLMLSLRDLLLTEPTRDVTQLLRDQVKNIITAAVETTSLTTNSVLFLLGNFPHMQDAVMSEMDEVLGTRLPDMQSLSRLTLLSRCIKEALRMYPVVPFVERHILEPVQLDKYEVPAGCDVIADIYHLHRNPEVWSNPDIFYPDRFLPENSQGRHPFAYIPFSMGARNCIGQAFGTMTTKLLLCGIFKNFRVEAARTVEELKFKFRLILYPEGSYPVKMYER